VSVRERLVDLGFAAGWALVKALPGRVAGAGFRAFADIATRRGGKGVRRLRSNLRRVVGPGMSEPDLDALTKRAMRSYARYWLEVFRLPVMRGVPERIETGTVGAAHIDAALAAGKGIVLALPHSGNWDAAATWLVWKHGKFTTVAERLKPESLYRRFMEYRESIGMEVIPLSGGERPPTELLTERLRANGVICLLGDRDLTRNGIEVTFFGARTKMPAGPALLAATTGAALLAVHLTFDDDGGWRQRIGPVIPLPQGRLRDKVQAGTQGLADAFAAGIASRPEDWHMLQRLWLADLDPATESDEPPGAAAASPAEA
jgi:phosphatidylinositol dimannoside acyltransferase